MASHYFFPLLARPPTTALFPYTTLFRSGLSESTDSGHHRPGPRGRSEPAATRGDILEPEGNAHRVAAGSDRPRSEEHTSELQSRRDLVCRLLLEKKKI